MLENRTVVVGVCGGIAAYKAAAVVSRLKKTGANVRVMMTEAAAKFVTPLTFETISQNAVASAMFDMKRTFEIEHISLAQAADAVIIVPATANIIGKAAAGIADDIVSATIMATKAPVIFAPAMNNNMYENPVVQKNIETLSNLGYSFVEPAYGQLACGTEGRGRLAEADDIVEAVVAKICYSQDFKGKKVLVTAGPTHEYIDAVRFISNPSSGKMGHSIAKAAVDRGANVTLITGRVAIAPPAGVRVIDVESAMQMYDAVMGEYAQMDVVIKAAAVSDFRPAARSSGKIKKSDVTSFELVQNPDILEELGAKVRNTVLVGFSMDTDDLLSNANEKLVRKNLDMIIANDLNEEGAGFESDTNVVTLLTRTGNESLPLMSKAKLAHVILDRVKELLI